MCSITAAIAVVGGVVNIAGQMAAGRAAQAQANYQAAVARNNQILAERAAVEALAQGETAAAKEGLRTRQLRARQRTQFAEHGVKLDFGSALDITDETLATGREEEAQIRRNAERQALGFRTEGMNFAASAELARLRGQAAMREARWNALGTLITTAGTVASKWPKSKPRIDRTSRRGTVRTVRPTALQLSGPF